jgi:TIR domain
VRDLLRDVEMREAHQLLAEHVAFSPEPGPRLHVLGETAPVESDVICSVFAPPEVQSGAEISIQAFLHLAEQLMLSARTAAERDPTARRRGAATLTTRLRPGTVVQFYLDSPTLIVKSPASQQVQWRGAPARVVFTVQVPNTITSQSIESVLHVGIDDIPIGEIAFTLYADRKITPAEQLRRLPPEARRFFSQTQSPATATPVPVGTSARRYKTAFISYARTDFPVVSFFAQGLGENGIKPCIDVSTLEPGDEWEKELPSHIGQADVFYLMWSDHAAKSIYVDQEARHAVGLHQLDRQPKRPRIKPTPLQQPWPEPPEYLRRFHFYSEWQAHRAAQAAGLIRPRDESTAAPVAGVAEAPKSAPADHCPGTRSNDRLSDLVTLTRGPARHHGVLHLHGRGPSRLRRGERLLQP